jgi:TP901 family phage tail tape measure protein
MWKVVAARIRGSESDLESMGESTDGLVTSTSKLQAKVKALTGGFDIMKDKDTYKDIYDIVVGIGERWSELSDIQRADLLETLAGKQRSNALAAALNNVDVIKAAYQTAENSEGSAEKELTNYQKGIDYSLERFKATFQEFSTSVLSSDTFKAVIDSGTQFLELLTKITETLGPLGTALTALGGFKFVSSIG